MPLPPAGSAERWAYDYVTSCDLRHKLDPGPPPREFQDAATALQLAAPGRPVQLSVAARGDKTPGRDALRDPARRARLLHTFLHHELQAAELMCRALLVFPDTPLAFRRGLLSICVDEIRHMAMYGEHLARLGFAYGDFPINDWFWQRIPAARTPGCFVGALGLGFEGANLDHTARFAERFRHAGDTAGAELQERVGAEEEPHVAFAVHWFERFSGPLQFERWRRTLPPPLSPLLLRGRPLNVLARRRAGYPATFLEQLETWQPQPHGS